MADFPVNNLEFPIGACIHSGHPAVATCNMAEFHVANYTAAAWPAANRAIYIPFVVDTPVTAKQMFWENGGVAGTTDVGIYDRNFARLVSLTATTNAGSIQIGNITDTLLEDGTYYMGMLASTVTTQTYWSATLTGAIPALRAAGCAQQAVGSATLPNPATPAVIASSYVPFVGVSFQATM